MTGDLVQAAALAPVSLVPRQDGSVAHFPHLIERAKPGLIAVTAQGQRFANEANSYHDFMQGLLAATPAGDPPEAWLVCDHAFIRYYGLGAVKPAPMPLGPWLANGYLQRGHTLAELAQACGMPVSSLLATVRDYNRQALDGRDRACRGPRQAHHLRPVDPHAEGGVGANDRARRRHDHEVAVAQSALCPVLLRPAHPRPSTGPASSYGASSGSGSAGAPSRAD